MLSTNKDLVGDAFKDSSYKITWKDKTDINEDGTITGITPDTKVISADKQKVLLKQIKSILTDGLPKSQSNNDFTLEIAWDANGNMQTIKCTTAAQPQE